jgi:hypothetical protein
MRQGTAGRLLLEEALPPDMRPVLDRVGPLDKKGIAALFDELARRHPADYPRVAKRLSDLGRDAAYATGGFSFGLSHLREPEESKAVKARLAVDLEAAKARPGLTDAQRDAAVVEVLKKYQGPLVDAVYAASEREKNPLAGQVKNVGRGNKASLAGIRAGDLLYEDHAGNAIPIPVLSPYSQGLKPHEYWAAGFGARRGVVDVKQGVADAGYFCLDEDTLVRMADGSERAIKDIKVDDHVIAVGVFGNLKGPAAVVAVHDNGVRDCRTYTFKLSRRSDAQPGKREYLEVATLSATVDHKVLRDCNDNPEWSWKGSAYGLVPIGQWSMYDCAIWVGRLAPDTLWAGQGSPYPVPYWTRASYNGRDYVHLASESEPAPRRTFDLTIDDPDHMFLLANGLVVSNSKILNQATHRLVVVARDAEAPHDPHQVRGLPVPTADPDNEGALLAHPAGTYGRNTVLTPAILAELGRQGVETILVRSPTVGGPPEGGVYARDAGVRDKGVLPPRGDYVGLAASQAVAERLTQSGLSSKHSGGVAGAGPTGLKLLDQLVNPPGHFPGGAAHAQVAGRVGAIEPAPQGGHYIHVAGTRHYAAPGLPPTVELNQEVEPGDVLSEGLPNPAEIVAHKGIGEGRRHFTGAFTAGYRRSGMAVSRRNVELLARGLLDHVEATEEFGPYVPGDVVPYHALEAAWEPREGSRHMAPRQALGKYLEAPVLHHTIGTKVSRGMLADFDRFAVGNVLAHDQPPPFHPVMIRGVANLLHDEDWATRHLGSNLQKGTLEAVHRGRLADPEGTSYVPAAALRREAFGLTGKTKGWEPRAVDRDRDGLVGDGTPQERPAPPSVLDELGI